METLGLRENLAANEGGSSVHLRVDSGPDAVGSRPSRTLSRLVDIGGSRDVPTTSGPATERRRGDRPVLPSRIGAINITEADPYTGDRTDHEDEIIGTKENTDEDASQWATVQLVGNAAPIVLDARPVRRGETRKEIVEDPLDTAQGFGYVDEVLLDREFDSHHVLNAVVERGLKYVVPKRMRPSEKAQAERLLKRDQEYYVTDRKLHLGNDEWLPTTKVYKRRAL